MQSERERHKAAAQRAAALQKANAVRVRRAELKRKIKGREEDPVALLRDLPRELEGVTLVEYLTLVPGFGRVKAQKVAKEVAWSPTSLLGKLPKTARARVADRLVQIFAVREANNRARTT